MKTGAWFVDRFIEDARKLQSACATCGRSMWLPRSKSGKYLTCGGACADARAAALKAERRRECLTCSKEFFPRGYQLNNGGGKYCCVQCSLPALEAGRTPETHAKAVLSRRASKEAGKWQPARGASNPRWTGGKEASQARLRAKDPELRRASRRAYLKANPDKAREWATLRRGQMVKRLPRGTIKKIGTLQRWRCAICRVDVRKKFHVDHVVPIARGGEHAGHNLQLLCPTCNVRKSAKDPIAYMQERGFLL